MPDGFKLFVWSLAVHFAVAASALSAEPAAREVTLTEFGLTLVPPPDLVRNMEREAQVGKALPASFAKLSISVIFEIDPAILERDKSRLPAHFIVAGSKVDTTGMTPDRQLRIANLGAGDSYFDTKSTDIKIAGIVAKRFQYRQKPLVGEPNKDLFDGGVKYFFCRPDLMLSVDCRFAGPSEKAFDRTLKDCDAAVATFKFTDQ